jgi:hypothetical protein
MIAIAYQFSSVDFDTKSSRRPPTVLWHGLTSGETNMKRIWPIALIGLLLLWCIALFPPRRPQRVEQSQLPVSRAFLFSKEFYLQRAENDSIRVEIDTGRMLSEIVLVVTFFGFLIATIPSSRTRNVPP